ncbi:MAG: SDR family oxidoreductase [Armatimonadetes bacterium]|nr:SDR family oxidoreductase [Armatimonadota bacterium]
MSFFLVTGGAGFIGSHMVRSLVRRGDLVRIFDNFSTGSPANLERALGVPVRIPVWEGEERVVRLTLDGGVELVAGDLRDPAACAAICEGVEVIFHLAALRSVPQSVEDPLATHDVNATGTLILMMAAQRAGVRRVVYASSSSVYGDAPELPVRESVPPRPRSPYAVSKLAGEQYALACARLHGPEVVSLRYFNVFGPGQDPDGPYAAVIPRFIKAALAGASLEVHGDGSQSRDFTYVDNVVEANLLAASAAGVSGEIFNIACGRRITIMAARDAVSRALGVPVAVRHTPPRAGDIRHSQADVSRAKGVLGYDARVGFDEGIRRSVEDLRARTLRR